MTDWSKVKSPMDRQRQAFDDLVNDAHRIVREQPIYKRTWDFVQNIKRQRNEPLKQRDKKEPDDG